MEVNRSSMYSSLIRQDPKKYGYHSVQRSASACHRLKGCLQLIWTLHLSLLGALKQGSPTPRPLNDTGSWPV